MPTVSIYPSLPLGTPINGDTSNKDIPPIFSTPAGLALVEIQGSISIDEPAIAAARQSGRPDVVFGRLEFPLYHGSAEDETGGADDDGWMKSVLLYVGQYQRLKGVVKKLAKPIAVVRALPQNDDGDYGGVSTTTELEVYAVVRYKILFAERPEPVEKTDV